MKISIIPHPSKAVIKEGRITDSFRKTEKINKKLQEEEYEIEISQDGIYIEGGSNTALLYANVTLEQIHLQCHDALPCLELKDRPVHSIRSFHIDCARHFIPIEELKKMIGMAAYFKFNYFHWHISDDQGWRIESRVYPLLHEIGAFRKGDHFGAYDSDEAEGGYYTRAQVKELVAYCRKLGIEIIPEVDMPGHVTAILAAYPKLSCNETEVVVGTKAGIYREIFCPGKEDTFTFIQNLIDDLLELFPGNYIHIGGDETPKERWKSCPHCQRRMKEEGLETPQQLQGYLENRIAAYLRGKGRTAIVWNEAASGGNLDTDIVLQLWTEDKGHMAEKHLQKGGEVILSNMMNSYCDYPYGFISLKSMYELDTEPKELTKQEAGLILGTECLVWTEYIRDARRLEELCWPRFAASAEAGWCGEGRPGYDSFKERMEVQFPVFEQKGISAELPENWIPSEEETRRQLEEFKKNFLPKDVEEFRKAQEEI